jgi:hypothetical protein
MVEVVVREEVMERAREEEEGMLPERAGWGE